MSRRNGYHFTPQVLTILREIRRTPSDKLYAIDISHAKCVRWVAIGLVIQRLVEGNTATIRKRLKARSPNDCQTRPLLTLLSGAEEELFQEAIEVLSRAAGARIDVVKKKDNVNVYDYMIVNVTASADSSSLTDEEADVERGMFPEIVQLQAAEEMTKMGWMERMMERMMERIMSQNTHKNDLEVIADTIALVSKYPQESNAPLRDALVNKLQECKFRSSSDSHH